MGKQPMTKEDLVALAAALRTHNHTADGRTEFTPDHLRVLADFCASQESDFDRQQWIDYIAPEGRQDERLSPVDRDPTLMPGATLEDNPAPTVNRDERIAKKGLAADR
jgi:hypothetical protein